MSDVFCLFESTADFSSLEAAARAEGVSLRRLSSAEELASEVPPTDVSVCVCDGHYLARILTARDPDGSEDTLAVLQWSRQDGVTRVFRFRAHETAALLERVQGLLRATALFSMTSLIGRSEAIAAVRREVPSLAPFREIAVMILGESGTGKELVARGLHRASSRPGARFVAINCAAIPTSLFESTLFGHARGAFTGASTPRAGLLQEAHGGTLFLDEVVDMPNEAQGKLLRALEQRTFRPVGADVEVPFEARVVSATNRDPHDEENLRKDLFHRLAGFTITIPPLRERAEDIRDLAPTFVNTFCERHGLVEHVLSPSALGTLERCQWSGNVRELKAVIEQLVVLSTEPVIDERLVHETLSYRHRALASTPPPRNALDAPGADLLRGMTLGDLERDLTLRILRRNDGNIAKTARDLGLPRSTLRARLDRYQADAVRVDDGLDEG